MPTRKQIEQLLAAEPDDLFLNFGLAVELAKEGLVDDALMRFNRVLELDPSYTAAHRQMGTLLILAGRRDDARVVLTRGIAAAQQADDGHGAREMRRLLDSIP